VLNQTPRHEDVQMRRCTAACILNFGTGWRWAISFTPPPFYSRGSFTIKN